MYSVSVNRVPMRLVPILLLALASLAAVPARAELALVMAEEAGCRWCARWNAEVAPVYGLTPEGRAAPLRRIDVRAPLPDDLSFDRRLHYTPTFVLMRDGQELGRIEGYPGEDFFWGLLGRLLERADGPSPEDG